MSKIKKCFQRVFCCKDFNNVNFPIQAQKKERLLKSCLKKEVKRSHKKIVRFQDQQERAPDVFFSVEVPSLKSCLKKKRIVVKGEKQKIVKFKNQEPQSLSSIKEESALEEFYDAEDESSESATEVFYDANEQQDQKEN